MREFDLCESDDVLAGRSEDEEVDVVRATKSGLKKVEQAWKFINEDFGLDSDC